MSEKRCTICKQSKPHLDFNVRRASRDGLQNICRSCNREKARNYYAQNRESHIRTIVARKAIQRRICLELVGGHLLTHPCVDCGEADPRVLDFDHRDGSQKTAEVMKLAQDGYSTSRVLAEIRKCDMRCRNCHAKVTYARQGFTWRDALVVRGETSAPD